MPLAAGYRTISAKEIVVETDGLMAIEVWQSFTFRALLRIEDRFKLFCICLVDFKWMVSLCKILHF